MAGEMVPDGRRPQAGIDADEQDARAGLDVIGQSAPGESRRAGATGRRAKGGSGFQGAR